MWAVCLVREAYRHCTHGVKPKAPTTHQLCPLGGMQQPHSSQRMHAQCAKSRINNAHDGLDLACSRRSGLIMVGMHRRQEPDMHCKSLPWRHGAVTACKDMGHGAGTHTLPERPSRQQTVMVITNNAPAPGWAAACAHGQRCATGRPAARTPCAAACPPAMPHQDLRQLRGMAGIRTIGCKFSKLLELSALGPLR